MSGIQIVGNTNSTTAAEVEVNTKALRSVIRPSDYGSLGIYSIAQASGTMAAGLGAAAPIFAFRFPSGGAATLVAVKKILFGAVGGSTAFAAGTGKFDLFAARSYTVSDTGGTDITPGAGVNSNKLRT